MPAWRRPACSTSRRTAPVPAPAIRWSSARSARCSASGRAADAACRVGSVKTNIGHTEGAAGVAGLIKVALSLDARRPSRQACIFKTPNPEIPWANLPLRVPAEASPWPNAAEPPIAGVSAFGIAGTNAHVVLQQYRAAEPSASDLDQATDDRAPRLLPISSHTDETLAALATDYAGFLEEKRGSLADTCYTAAVRREHQPHRVAVIGRGSG